MRIVFFHNLPSGGALRALYDKVRALERRGQTVSVVTFSTSDDDFLKLPKISGTYVRLPLEAADFPSLRDYLAVSEKAARLIEAMQTDAIIIDKCRFFGSPPILNFLRKPSVFYMHEPLRFAEYESLSGQPTAPVRTGSARRILKGLARPQLLFRHALIKKWDRLSLYKAPFLMTNSHFCAQWIDRVYGKKATVNYQGADTEFFTPGDGKNYRAAGQVLSVGRLDASKGHEFCLNVMSRLRPSERPRWILVADSADSGFEKYFKSQAEKKKVIYELRRRIPSEELRELYRESALLFCASYAEPFGLTALEAMACATPVLAVREGGYTETVQHEKTGLLLTRDEKIWVEVIERLLVEPDTRSRYGRAGRDTVCSQWTWDLFVDRLFP